MKKRRHGYFPDDCWELIFCKLREDDERDLDSISLVSKRFLSISNRVKLSLNVNDEKLPLLPNLLRRFRNIGTLVITANNEIDGLVDLISRSGALNLQAIKFCWCSPKPPRDGFEALALNTNIKDHVKALIEALDKALLTDQLSLGLCLKRTLFFFWNPYVMNPFFTSPSPGQRSHV
ncbi:hypothetical protein RHGRI_000247 [Rhododendron griersonianum]|uniref:F-box domain-containing protein n=1 Tax=Rhododendron griersonianum TaxID=479676 RepID=A0AAV6LH05_9ERIC|nr:hypothetical protein RHGRI_000247 [Rhododendron griersonianum]